MKNNFCHLHLHNEYSLLDGFGKAEQYVERAVELGQSRIGITNHGNIDGLLVFQNACQKAGIQPVLGCEAYIVQDRHKKEKGERRRHINFYIRNQEGFENLCRMLTAANLEGFYYKPRIDPDLVRSHYQGLVVSTACVASFIEEDWGKELFDDLARLIPGDVYYEYMPFDSPDQKELNKKISIESKKSGIKCIATNDCHYVKEDQEKTQEVLLAIQSKKKWKDPKRWKFDVTGLFLKSESEMREAFKKQGVLRRIEYEDAISNTIEIANKCKYKMPEIPVSLPKPPSLSGENDEVAFRRLCREGFEKKIKSNKKKMKRYEEYKERIKFEVDQIVGQGFCRYFLIVWDVIKWCRENGIMTGTGRGSSGGSLACYLLNIVSCDPVEFGLLFSRFISPARIDFPDIDMDFEDRKRHKIREYFEEIYGKYNVVGVSTFGRMRSKMAIRDVSRVFDVPLIDVGKATACIVDITKEADDSIQNAFSTFEDGIKFNKKYPEVTRIAIEAVDQIRNKGQHAAAICISTEDFREGKRGVLEKGNKDIICNWGKKDIEHFGIMKLDVLGLRALSRLSAARELIKKNHDIEIDYESLPLDDKKVIEYFSKGKTTGCFQFGTTGMKRFCKQAMIENFEDIASINALYRPGTLRNGTAEDFIQRRKGKRWEKKHPLIEEITKETYGIILYQEQIMNFIHKLAGLDWRTCDTIRKVISKSQGDALFRSFKEQFAKGCEEKKTLDRETAERLWEELASFGSYSFNKSHAVEYSMIAYWDMWVKAYYPAEFIVAGLTYGGSPYIPDLIRESFDIGLDVRPPKIGKSLARDWKIENNILYTPYIEIKGVGEKYVDKIYDYYKKEDQGGFFKEKKKITDRYLKLLDKINAFKDEPVSNEFAESIKDLFDFDFFRDNRWKVEKIIKKMGMKFENLKDIDFGKNLNSHKYFFVEVDEIKFSFKSKNKGGMVYGYVDDKTDRVMIIFNRDLYKKKKGEIEHGEGKFAVIEVVSFNKNFTAANCSNIWFEEDIFSLEIDGLDLSLIEKKRFSDPAVKECQECKLRKDCSSPIPGEKGFYNLMIIGESPTRSDDRKGRIFSDGVGDLIKSEIFKYRLDPELFNWTNFVKCQSGKSPGKREINKCSQWIDREIDQIKPSIVLSFGNSGIKYFTGEDSGIMKKSGTTEWNDDKECWICWCIHPASVLYHSENREMFEKGIENFCKKVKKYI